METLQLTLGGVALTLWILWRAARRYPHVGWLQPFADAFPSRTARPRKSRTQHPDFESYVRAGMPPIVASEPRVSAVERVRADMMEREGRRRDVYAGAQLILLGLAIPIGYPILDMMLWSTMTRTEWIVAGAASLLCITLGIIAIWTSRKP